MGQSVDDGETEHRFEHLCSVLQSFYSKKHLKNDFDKLL